MREEKVFQIVRAVTAKIRESKQVPTRVTDNKLESDECRVREGMSVIRTAHFAELVCGLEAGGVIDVIGVEANSEEAGVRPVDATDTWR